MSVKSPSEQLYSNITWKAVRRAPNLLRNLGFLIAAFIAIRLGSFIPIGGVNTDAWGDIFRNSPFAHLIGLL